MPDISQNGSSTESLWRGTWVGLEEEDDEEKWVRKKKRKEKKELPARKDGDRGGGDGEGEVGGFGGGGEVGEKGRRRECSSMRWMEVEGATCWKILRTNEKKKIFCYQIIAK